MPDLEAVLFDLYDTLVWMDWNDPAVLLADRLGVSAEQVSEAYEELRPLRDGGAFPDPESVLSAVVEYCGVPREPSLVADLAAWEAALLSERVVLHEDSLPVLRRLRALGVATAVVSNCSPSTRPVVDRLNLEEETEAVILSCEVGVAKPDPAIFRAALQALGAGPEQSMFVDDRTEYLDGAARLGLRTMQIVRGGTPTEGSHPRIGDLHRLLELLD